jgi:cytoskeleton protein RodZ
VFEIGISLREARLRQNLELTDAELATKIRSKYLKALEQEQFELLPAQTYVKGFLRSYAEYLGLDGQLYVDEYNSRYVSGEDDSPYRARRSQGGRPQGRKDSNAIVWALAGIAVVTALVIAAWRFGGGEEQQRIPNLGRTTAEATQPKAKKPGAWIALVLKATRGNSAVTVSRRTISGRVLFDGTLERGGEAHRFTGPRLVLQLTNPENLRATIDGKRVRIPVRGGSEPVVVAATRKGIRSISRG